jgi:FMN phosphatase YigB (HAD superfamily)
MPLDLDGLEVVSWDVDGTLYSLPRLRRTIAYEVLRGVPRLRTLRDMRELMRLQRWRRRMEAARHAGGQLVLDGAAQQEREVVRALERRWYAGLIGRIGARPAALELIAAFAARGLRQVVVSDYDAADKLDALGLGARFPSVFSGERLGWLKPAPALFARVHAELGVSPARWLHIGDRADTDGASAAAIGCRCLILDEHAVPSRRLAG